jgi:hypothetical protein
MHLLKTHPHEEPSGDVMIIILMDVIGVKFDVIGRLSRNHHKQLL